MSLTRELEQAIGDANNLRAQMNTLTDRRQQLEAEVSQLTHDLSSVTSELEASTQQMNSLKEEYGEEISRIHFKGDNLDQELNDKINLLEKATSDLVSANDTISTLKSSFEESKNNLNDLELQNKHLVRELNILKDGQSEQGKEFDEKTNSLLAQLSELEAEVSKYQKINSEQEETISDLSSHMQEKEEKLKTMSFNLEELKTNFLQKEEHFRETEKEQLKSAALLQSSLSSVQEELASADYTISELRSTVESKDSELSTLRESSARLQQQVDSISNELQSSASQVADFQAQNTALQGQIASYSEKLTNLTKSLDEDSRQMQQVMEGLQEEKETQETLVASLERQVLSLEAEVQAVRASGVDKDAQITVLGASHSEQERRADGLQTSLLKLCAERDDLNQQVRTLCESNQLALQDVSNLQSSLDTVLLDKHALQTRVDSLNASLVEQSQHVHTLSDTCKNLELSLSDKELKRSELSHKLDHLQSSLHSMHEDNVSKSASLESLQGLYDQEHEHLLDITIKLENTVTECQHANTQITSLQASLEKEHTKLNKMCEKCQALESEVEQCKNEISQLTDSLSLSKEQLSSLDSSSKSAIESLNDKISALNSDLEEMKKVEYQLMLQSEEKDREIATFKDQAQTTSFQLEEAKKEMYDAMQEKQREIDSKDIALQEESELSRNLKADLERKCADFEKLDIKAKALSCEVTDLKSAMEEKTSEAADLLSQTEKMSSENSSIASQLESVSKNLTEVTKQKEGCASQLVASEEKIVNLQANLAEVQARLVETQSQLASRDSQIMQRDTDLNHAKVVVDEKSVLLENLLKKKEEFEVNEKEYLSKIESLQKEKSDLSKSIKELSEELSSYEKMLSDKEEQLKASSDRYSSDISNCNEQIERLSQTLKEQEEDFKTQVSAFESCISVLKEKLESTESSFSVVKMEASQAAATAQDSQSKLQQELEASKSQLAAIDQAYQTEIATLRSDLHAKDVELQTAIGEAHDMSCKCDSLQQELSGVNDKLKESVEEIRLTCERLEKADQAEHELSLQLNESRKENVCIKEKCECLENKLEFCKKTLSDISAKSENLVKEDINKSHQLASLEEQVNLLLNENSALVSDCDDKKSIVTSLTQELECYVKDKEKIEVLVQDMCSQFSHTDPPVVESYDILLSVRDSITYLNSLIEDKEKSIKEHQVDIMKLKELIDSMKSEAETMKEELVTTQLTHNERESSMKLQLEEQQVHLSNYESEIASLKNDLSTHVASSEEQLAELRILIDSQQAQLLDKDSFIKRLQTSLTSVESDLRNEISLKGKLNSEKDELHKVNINAGEELMKAKSEVSRLNQLLEQLDDEKQVLENKLSSTVESLVIEKSELNLKLCEAQDKLNIQEVSFKDQEKEIENLRHDVSTATAESSGLEEALEAANKKIDGLELENAQLHKSLEHLEVTLNTFQGEMKDTVASLKSSLEEKGRLVSDLTNELNEKIGVISNQEEEISEKRKKSASLEELLKALKEELQNVNSSKTEADSAVIELQQKLTSEFQAKQTEKGEHDQTIKQLKANLSKLSAAEQRVSELEVELQTATQESSVIKDKLCEALQVIKCLERNAEESESSYQKKCGEVEDLQRHTTKLETELDEEKVKSQNFEKELKMLIDGHQDLSLKFEQNKKMSEKFEHLLNEANKEVIEKSTALEEAKADTIRSKLEHETTLTELKEELKNTASALEESNMMCSQLKDDIISKEQEKLDSLEDTGKLRKLLETEQEAKEAFSRKCSDYEQQLIVAENDNRSQTDKLKIQAETVQKLREDLSHANEKVYELELNLQTQHESANKTESDMSVLQNQLSDKEAQLGELSAKLQDTESEFEEENDKFKRKEEEQELLLQDSNSKLMEKDKAISSLRSDVKVLEAKIKDLVEEKHTLKNEKENLASSSEETISLLSSQLLLKDEEMKHMLHEYSETAKSLSDTVTSLELQIEKIMKEKAVVEEEKRVISESMHNASQVLEFELDKVNEEKSKLEEEKLSEVKELRDYISSLQEKIELLTADVSRMDSEKLHLQGENNMCTNKLHELSNEKLKLMDENETYIKNLKDKDNEVAQLKIENTELSESLDLSSNKLKEVSSHLQDTINHLQSFITEQNTIITVLQEDSLKQQDTEHSLLAIAASSRTLLLEGRKRTEAIRQELVEVQEEKETLLLQKNDLAQQLQEVTDMFHQMSDEKAKVEKSLSDSISDLYITLDKTEKDVAFKQEQIDELESKMSLLTDEQADAQRKLKGTIESLQNTTDELEAVKAGQNHQLISEAERSKAHEKEIASLKDKMETICKDLQIKDEESQVLQTKYQNTILELQAQVAEFEQELLDSSESLQLLQHRNQELETKLGGFQEELGEKTKVIFKLQADLSTSQRDLKEKNKAVEVAQGEISHLQEEMETSKKVHEKERQTDNEFLNDLQDKINILETTLREKGEELLNTQSQNTILTSTTEELEGKMYSLDTRYLLMERQLSIEKAEATQKVAILEEKVSLAEGNAKQLENRLQWLEREKLNEYMQLQAEADSEAQRFHKQNSSLEKQLGEKDDELTSLRLKFEATNDEFMELTSELKDLKDILHEHKNTRLEAEKMVATLEGKHQMKELKLHELSLQLKSSHQLVQAVQSELGESVSEITRKGTIIHDLEAEIETLVKARDTAETELASTKEQNRELTMMVGVLKVEKQNNDHTLSRNLEKVNTALFDERTKNSKLQKGIRELKNNVQKMSKDRQHAEENLDVKATNLKTSLAQKVSEIKQLGSLIDECKISQEEILKSLAERNTEDGETKSLVQSAKEELEEQISKCQETKSILAEILDKSINNRSILDSVKNNIGITQESFQESLKQISDLQSAVKAEVEEKKVLKESVADLSGSLDSLRNIVEATKQDLAEEMDRRKKLAEELRKSLEIRQAFEDELSNVRQQLADTRSAVLATDLKLHEQVAVSHSMQSELETVSNQQSTNLSEYSHQTEVLEAECANLKTELRSVKDEMERLTEELSHAREEYDFLKQVSDFTTKELQELKAASAEDNTALEDSRSELFETKTAYKKLSHEMLALHESLEQSKHESMSQILEKNTELDEAKAKEAAKQEELDNMNTLLSDIRTEIQDKNEQIEMISKINETAENTITGLEGSLSVVAKEKLKLLQEVSNLEGRILQLTSQKESTDHHNSLLSAEVENSKDLLEIQEKLQKSVDDLYEQLEQERSNGSSLREEKQRLGVSCEELEKTVSELTSKNLILAEQLGSMQSSSESLVQDIKSKEDQLLTAYAKYESELSRSNELQLELEAAKIEMDELLAGKMREEDMIVGLQNQISQAETDKVKVSSQLETLIREKEDMYAYQKEIQEALGEKQSEMDSLNCAYKRAVKDYKDVERSFSKLQAVHEEIIHTKNELKEKLLQTESELEHNKNKQVEAQAGEVTILREELDRMQKHIDGDCAIINKIKKEKDETHRKLLNKSGHLAATVAHLSGIMNTMNSSVDVFESCLSIINMSESETLEEWVDGNQDQGTNLFSGSVPEPSTPSREQNLHLKENLRCDGVVSSTPSAENYDQSLSFVQEPSDIVDSVPHTVAHYKGRLSSLKNTFIGLVRDKGALEREHQNLLSLVEQTVAERESSESQLQAIQGAYDLLQEEVNHMVSELQELRKALADKEISVQNVDDMKLSLESGVEDLKNTISVLSKEKEQEKVQKEIVMDLLEEVEGKQYSLESEMSALKAQTAMKLNELEENLRESLKQNSLLKQDIASAEDHYQSEFETIKSQLDESVAQNDDIEVKCREAESLVQVLRDELSALKQQRDRDIKDLKLIIEQSEEECQKLENEITSIKEDKSAIEAERIKLCDHIEASIENAKVEQDALMQRNTDLENQIKTLLSDLDVANQLNQTLQKELKDTKQETLKLNTTLEEFEKLHNAAIDKISSLEHSLSEVNESLIVKNAILETLTSRIKEVEENQSRQVILNESSEQQTLYSQILSVESKSSNQQEEPTLISHPYHTSSYSPEFVSASSSSDSLCASFLGNRGLIVEEVVQPMKVSFPQSKPSGDISSGSSNLRSELEQAEPRFNQDFLLEKDVQLELMIQEMESLRRETDCLRQTVSRSEILERKGIESQKQAEAVSETLRETVSTLEDELQRGKENEKILKNDMEQLRSTVFSLEEELKEEKHSLDFFSCEAQTLQSKLVKQQQELDLLRNSKQEEKKVETRREELSLKISKLEHELQEERDLKVTLDSLQAECDELRSSVSRLEEDLKKEKEAKDELEKMLRKKEKVIQGLHLKAKKAAKLAKIEGEASSLKVEEDAFMSMSWAQSTEEDLSGLSPEERQFRQLLAQYQSASVERVTLKELIQEKDAEIVRLQTQYYDAEIQWKENMERFEAENSRLQDRLQQEGSLSSALSDKERMLKEELKVATSELLSTSQILEATVQSNKSEAGVVQNLQEKLQSALAAHEYQVQTINQLESQVMELQARENWFQTQVAERDEQLKSINDTLELARSEAIVEKYNLNQMKVGLEDEISSLKEKLRVMEIESLNNNSSSLQTSPNNETGAIQSLKAELAKRDETITIMESVMKDMYGTQDENSSKIGTLSADLEAVKEELANMQTEKIDMQKLMKKKDAKIVALSKRVNTSTPKKEKLALLPESPVATDSVGMQNSPAGPDQSPVATNENSINLSSPESNQDDFEMLKAEILGLRKLMKKKDAHILTVNKKLNSLQSEQGQLSSAPSQESVSGATGRMSSLSHFDSGSTLFSDNVSELNDRLKQVEFHRDALESQVRDLEVELDNLKEDNLGLRHGREDVEEEMHYVARDKRALEDCLFDIRDIANAEAVEELAGEDLLYATVESVRLLVEEKVSAERHLSEMQKWAEVVEKKHEEDSRIVTESKTAVQKLESDLAHLKFEHEQTWSQLEQTITTKAALEEQLEALRGNMQEQDLQEMLRESSVTIKQLQQNVQSLSTDKQELEFKLHSIEEGFSQRTVQNQEDLKQLKEQLQQAREEKEEINRQFGALYEQLQGYQTSQAAAEEYVVQLQAQMRDTETFYAAKIDGLSSKLSEAEIEKAKLHDLEEMTSSQNAKIESLEKIIESLQFEKNTTTQISAELLEAQNKVSDLRTMLKSKEAKFSALSAEHDELAVQYEKLQGQLEMAEAANQSLKDHTETIETSELRQRSELQSMEEQLTYYRTATQHLNEECASIQSQLHHAHAGWSRDQETHKELEEQLDTSKKYAQEIQEELNREKHRHQEAQRENKILMDQLEQRGMEQNVLQSELEKARDSGISTAAQISALETMLSEKTAALEDDVGQIQSVYSVIGDEGSSYYDMSKKIQDLKAKARLVESQTETIASLQNELSVKSSSLANLEKELAVLQASCENTHRLEQKLLALKSELQLREEEARGATDASRKISELQEEISALQQDKQTAVDSLQQTVNHLATENENLKSEKGKLEETVQLFENQLLVSRQEIEKYQQDIGIYENKIKESETNIKDLQTKLLQETEAKEKQVEELSSLLTEGHQKLIISEECVSTLTSTTDSLRHQVEESVARIQYLETVLNDQQTKDTASNVSSDSTDSQATQESSAKLKAVQKTLKKRDAKIIAQSKKLEQLESELKTLKEKLSHDPSSSDPSNDHSPNLPVLSSPSDLGPWQYENPAMEKSVPSVELTPPSEIHSPGVSPSESATSTTSIPHGQETIWDQESPAIHDAAWVSSIEREIMTTSTVPTQGQNSDTGQEESSVGPREKEQQPEMDTAALYAEVTRLQAWVDYLHPQVQAREQALQQAYQECSSWREAYNQLEKTQHQQGLAGDTVPMQQVAESPHSSNSNNQEECSSLQSSLNDQATNQENFFPQTSGATLYSGTENQKASDYPKASSDLNVSTGCTCLSLAYTRSCSHYKVLPNATFELLLLAVQ